MAIEVYTKSGIINDQPVSAFILKSHRHKWLKTQKFDTHVTKKQADSLGLIWALKHIKTKHKKKKIIIYTDSEYMTEFLSDLNKSSSVNSTKSLRDCLSEFVEWEVKPFPLNELSEELNHIYQECGLDGIELEEKE